MNVNEKGSLGLIEVIRDLTKKGYECFTPLHDYSPVDLIVLDKNFQPTRLQVKYREFKDNVIEVGFCTVVNGKKLPIDLKAVDGWAVYCADVDQICYFSKQMIKDGSKGYRIRKQPREKQVDSIPTPLYTDLVNEMVLWKDGREA